jgi:hypothetical protein
MVWLVGRSVNSVTLSRTTSTIGKACEQGLDVANSSEHNTANGALSVTEFTERPASKPKHNPFLFPLTTLVR